MTLFSLCCRNYREDILKNVQRTCIYEQSDIMWSLLRELSKQSKWGCKQIQTYTGTHLGLCNSNVINTHHVVGMVFFFVNCNRKINSMSKDVTFLWSLLRCSMLMQWKVPTKETLCSTIDTLTSPKFHRCVLIVCLVLLLLLTTTHLRQWNQEDSARPIRDIYSIKL